MNVKKCLRKQNEYEDTFTSITKFTFYDIFELVNLRFFFIHAAAQNGITTIYLHIFCMWQQRTNDVYMGNKKGQRYGAFFANPYMHLKYNHTRWTLHAILHASTKENL